MDDLTRHHDPCIPERHDQQALIDAQNRVIADQAQIIRYYQDLLNLEVDGDNGHDGRQPPWYLWDGPYPLQVGPNAPSNIKVWFNTTSNALLVWNWQTQQWQPAMPTVITGATPSSTALGTLWLDAAQKLWVHIDDWRELTMPIIGGPTVQTGAVIVTSTMAPASPANGSLWFEPKHQDLSVWNGSLWIKIGVRVDRNVRIPNPLNTWNAGGNRAQAVRAGEILWVAGIRGISPLTQQQLPGPGPQNTQGTVSPNTAANGNARIEQIYANIQAVVESEGLSLYDCFMLHTAMVSGAYIGPTATLQALPQFWGTGPFPNRTHEVWLQMSGGDQEREFGADIPMWPTRGDIVEVTSIFFTGRAGKRKPTSMAADVKAIPGVQVGTGLPPPRTMPPPPPPPEHQRVSMEAQEPPKHPRKRK
jgi:enamine deaminase RidA (YjgF/YER057c/UK114 family)